MNITLKMLPRATVEMMIDALHTYCYPLIWLWRWLKRRLGTRLGFHVHQWSEWEVYRESGWGSMNRRTCKTCGDIDLGWSPDGGY